MSQETINPVRHGVLGSAAATTGGAVGGGVKSGAKAFLYTAALGAVVGAVVMSGGTLLGLLGVAEATTAGISSVLGYGLLGGVLGGLGGGLVGSFISPFAGIIGAVKGGSNAAARVREEKGAANMLDAQLSAYQAQAYAAQAQPTVVYAPSATNNNRYAAASTMNQAPLSIQGGTGTNLGTIDGKQLALA